jgi:membrane peptidoglycan carboxypeptidase
VRRARNRLTPADPGDHSLEARSIATGSRVRLAAGSALALLVVVGLAVATLFTLTPSADSAAARAGAWIAGHRAGPPLAVLPARVAAAVIATEDHNFYQHHGLDVYGLGRAARGWLFGQDAGGSTIEVQLAKLLYTGTRPGHLDQAEQAAEI